MKQPILKKLIVVPIALLATCHLASAVEIDFTTPDYSDGVLDGNSSGAWENVNVDFTVTDSASSGAVNLPSSGGVAVYQNQVLDFNAVGSTFSAYIDVQWTQNDEVLESGSTTFAELAYYRDSNGSPIPYGRLGVGRSSRRVDGYRMAGLDYRSFPMTGADLGIDSARGDLLSDVIRISFDLIKGDSATTWVGHYTVTNLTTDTVVLSGTRRDMNIERSASGVNTDTTVYLGFNSGNNHLGMAEVEVQRFGKVDIPEGATCALFAGLFALSWSMVRRRTYR